MDFENKKIGEMGAIIADAANRLKVDAPEADADGVFQLKLEDEFTFYLRPLEDGSGIFAFAQLAELPDDTPAEVFRELLDANLFGEGSGNGFFALEDASGALVWQTRMPADAQALADGILSAANLCRWWTFRLLELSGAALEEEGEAEGGNRDAGATYIRA